MLIEKQLSRKARGFTLTEAAIVLGIVGLILGAIWVAAGAVYDNLRVSKTSEQLLTIVQNVRSMHATQSNVAGISALNVAKAGGIPKDMLNDPTNPTTVLNVWGGAVDIVATGTGNDSFYIVYAGVPQRACVDLLVRNTGVGRDTGLLGAGAVNGAVTNNNLPVNINTAVGYCSNTTATGNFVSFTFRLKS